MNDGKWVVAQETVVESWDGSPPKLGVYRAQWRKVRSAKRAKKLRKKGVFVYFSVEQGCFFWFMIKHNKT